jgi:hypothetical protein
VLLLIATAALAQQQQQQQAQSPSQLAIQIDQAIGLLAQRTEFAESQVKQLQEELAKLKAKCGEACK